MRLLFCRTYSRTARQTALTSETCPDPIILIPHSPSFVRLQARGISQAPCSMDMYDAVEDRRFMAISYFLTSPRIPITAVLTDRQDVKGNGITPYASTIISNCITAMFFQSKQESEVPAL